jgi:hypothetical protein
MFPQRSNDDSIYMAAGGVIGFSICIVLFLLLYYYFSNQLGTATAYGTIIGAMANLFLAFTTWSYLGEVRKQVSIMAADTKSSKAKEYNKYNSDTMIKLIAPLYFNKVDELLFGITNSFHREHGYELGTKAYFDFWDLIMTNMHLAPPSLFSTLERYLDAKDAYWEELDEHFAGDMHSQLAKTAEGQRLIKKFHDTRSELSTEIDIVYKNLKKELRPTEIP